MDEKIDNGKIEVKKLGMTRVFVGGQARAATVVECLDEKDLERVKIGERVKVVGRSKGKGFSGVIKRHGFSRGPETHGSHHHRAPGSIGSMFPQRVIKGKKMPGHLGNTQVTVKNLEILDIDKDKKLIIVAGSLPGPNQKGLSLAKDRP